MNIQSIKSRLLFLVENRVFYFKGTRKDVAEKYLQELKTFKGISDSDRIKLEIECRGRFPRSFKKFLKEMGGACGQLFYGCDICPANTSQLRMKELAGEIIEDGGIENFLKPSDFIFVFFQGVSFYYIQAEGERNSAVYEYEEGAKAPVKVSGSFEDFIEKQLTKMEEKYTTYKNTGGYSLTLSEEGYMSMMFGGKVSSSPFESRDEFIP